LKANSAGFPAKRLKPFPAVCVGGKTGRGPALGVFTTGQVGQTVSFYTPAGGKRGVFCAKSPRKVKNARANRIFSAQTEIRPRKTGGRPRKPENRRAK
jgi:hypothetical protein